MGASLVLPSVTPSTVPSVGHLANDQRTFALHVLDQYSSVFSQSFPQKKSRKCLVLAVSS